MAIQFDTDTKPDEQWKAAAFAHMARNTIRAANGADLKPADPMPPPPIAPVLNMSPRRHDVVRWDHAGFVTKTAHDTKERALEHAASLHWATTWKWAVMCGRDFVERRELQEPADYHEAKLRWVENWRAKQHT